MKYRVIIDLELVDDASNPEEWINQTIRDNLGDGETAVVTECNVVED